jgi:choline dehydrogenase
MILFREKGPEPGLRQPPAQPILRYTAERSTTRNDMQIGTIAMDGAYLPPPITPDDVCFVIFAALHKAVGAGELRVASTDPHIQPAINYNYLADNWDRERMREGIRLGIRLSEHPALKERVLERVSPADADLATDAALDAWVMANVGSGFHSAGTCKMGPASDPMAVVDQFCRVRGLAGLRVADASVMPDVIRANTNATVAMIAERVADWMREGR